MFSLQSVLLVLQTWEQEGTHAACLISTLDVKALSTAVREDPGPAHSQPICISGGKPWLFCCCWDQPKPRPLNCTGGKNPGLALKPLTMEKASHTHTHIHPLCLTYRTLQRVHCSLDTDRHPRHLIKWTYSHNYTNEGRRNTHNRR